MTPVQDHFTLFFNSDFHSTFLIFCDFTLYNQTLCLFQHKLCPPEFIRHPAYSNTNGVPQSLSDNLPIPTQTVSPRVYPTPCLFQHKLCPPEFMRQSAYSNTNCVPQSLSDNLPTCLPTKTVSIRVYPTNFYSNTNCVPQSLSDNLPIPTQTVSPRVYQI